MDPILTQCLAGSSEAWTQFVRRYSPLIFSTVRRTLSRRAGGTVSVEDVTQDVFLRLVKNNFALLRSYDPQRAAVTTWLTVVAHSAAVNALRRQAPPTASLAQIADALPDPAPVDPARGPPGTDPATAQVPMDLLSPRQRLVLQLLYDRQLEVAQAAALMGVDEQTVRSTHHKAILKLRAHFASSPPANRPAGDAATCPQRTT